jgi:hypothetical protein
MVVTDIFQINQFSVRNKIGKIAKIFVKTEDPENRGVLCLHKYFGNFTNFISHTKLIYLKNIGHNHGNTSSGSEAMEAVCTVWLCLVVSIDSMFGFMSDTHSFHCHCLLST